MVCFIKEKRSSNLVTIFYYVIDPVYIYSWKKIDKILTYLEKVDFLFSHVVFNLINECTPFGGLEHSSSTLVECHIFPRQGCRYSWAFSVLASNHCMIPSWFELHVVVVNPFRYVMWRMKFIYNHSLYIHYV